MKDAPKMDILARTAVGVNYAGAFLLFCKGSSLPEIAESFDLNLTKLTERARSEDWEMLARQQSVLTIPPRPTHLPVVFSSDELKAKETRIQQNRDQALSVAVRIRDNILKILDAHAHKYTLPAPDELLTLARAAKIANDASMVAVGDTPAAVETGTGKPASTSGPSIVINLPSSIAGPRSTLRAAEREVEAQVSHVTDAEAIATESVPEDPPDPDAKDLIEVNVVSAASDSPEAVPTPSGSGFTVDFQALARAANPPPPKKVPAFPAFFGGTVPRFEEEES